MMNGDPHYQQAGVGGAQPPRTSGEYRSGISFFGLPLVHIATGYDPETGRMRVARGVIAIGNVAFGVIALGGVSFGVLSLGGLAVGALTLGGMSLGVLAAFGGFALSLYVAVGGAAVAGKIAVGGFAFSLEYAYGGFAIARHPYGANYQDPQALEYIQNLIRSIFGDLKW